MMGPSGKHRVWSEAECIAELVRKCEALPRCEHGHQALGEPPELDGKLQFAGCHHCEESHG